MPVKLGFASTWRQAQPHVCTRQLAAYFKVRHIKPIKGEDVVMHQRIVPWRTRTEVAIVVPSHIRVTGEPVRVVVAAAGNGERTRACRSVSFLRCLNVSFLLFISRVVVRIIGALAAILRAGQTERVDFVISGSSDLPVTGSPIEGAVHDRWPIDY